MTSALLGFGGCRRGQRVPPEAVSHSHYCAQYLDAGEYVQAKARCRLAIEYAEKYPIPWNLLGLIAYREGKFEESIKHYKKAISLNDDFADAHNNLGAVYLAKDQCKMALGAFESAVEINPGFMAARFNRGFARTKCGDKAAGKTDYIKCLELDPNYCDCHQGLGAAYIEEEEFDLAADQFARMTEACPSSPEAYYNLCWTQLKLNQCAKAVDSCAEAIELRPQYREARQNLKEAKKCAEAQDRKVRRLMNLLEQQPEDPGLHFRLAKAYTERRMWNEAASEFQAVIRLEPSHAEAHYMMARMMDRQGEGAGVREYCSRFDGLVVDDSMRREVQWCRAQLASTGG